MTPDLGSVRCLFCQQVSNLHKLKIDKGAKNYLLFFEKNQCHDPVVVDADAAIVDVVAVDDDVVFNVKSVEISPRQHMIRLPQNLTFQISKNKELL